MTDEIVHLIPFYINGTLSPKERIRVERSLLETPESRETFFDWLTLKQDLATRVTEMESGYEEGNPDAFAARLKKRTTLYVPIRKATARYLRIPAWVWQPATLVIVLLQFAAILLFMTGIHIEKRSTYQILSCAPPAASAGTVVYNVIFQPDATEKEIREILLRYHAKIIGGPNKIGLYRIKVGRKGVKEMEKFKHDELVQFMEKRL